MNKMLGKIGYGLIFMLFLPLLLVGWAKVTENIITLPFPHTHLGAYFLSISGLLLMLWAMLDLWFRGKGLPMNAYPPEKLVTRGAYYFFSHPIYVGASLMSFGLSLAFESKSGFWLISPILTLSWLALLWGFEKNDLKNRFKNVEHQSFFSLPKNNAESIDYKDIIATYFIIFLPWICLYELVIFIGTPTYSISTFLPLESSIPVWEWAEFFYLICYPFVGIVPLFIKQKSMLRLFAIDGLLATGIGIFLQIILPFVAVPKAFFITSFWGELLAWERTMDGASAAFPSFHVIWTLLACQYYTALHLAQSNANTSFKILVIHCLGWAIIFSCLMTGMHSLLDILAGILVYLVIVRKRVIWLKIKTFFEKLANSWSAWQVGQLRVINHSIYAGLSGFVGVLIACMLIGNWLAVLCVGVFALVGAGLWAQIVEGSATLSRPFGYYGCIIFGIIACILVAYLFKIPFIVLLTSFALASPWVQAIGRFRCVVQGCCHGKIAHESIGIKVTHEKSRVCAISHLKKQPIHLTPLYSIISNLIIGAFLWRLWYSEVALQLIVSLYFMLSGISRFVEEDYRGEIQTFIWNKLKIYQWLAIGSLLFGILFSMIPFPTTYLSLYWENEFLLVSLLFGLLAAFAMGMDFPFSNKRFSRLAN